MSRKFTDAEVNAMSPGYWERWNDALQLQIDKDIEANRKCDVVFKLENAPAGTEVHAEQISHDFIFGAHIFNFDQLGSDECNRKYRELYGTLFNSATIAFYWKQFEIEEGKPRFHAEYRDTPEFWNNCPDPKHQPHWRRPSPEKVIEFCREKNIRLHGHTLVWGNNRWHTPDWLINKIPYEALVKANLNRNPKDGTLNVNATASVFDGLNAEEFADKYPVYTEEINKLLARRIYEIAMHCGDVFDSWDVVNESSLDFIKDVMVPGSRICKTRNGPMPGDYAYRAFKVAESVFPPKAKLNINDHNLAQEYVDQIADLRKRGCKIDIMGAQMHIFDPQTCQDIADGKSDAQSPESVIETMKLLSLGNLPIHMSEITITAPSNKERGELIQAVIAHNLYRLWFSTRNVMGITWWNVVDDCGASGEPSTSGLFHRDMTPKKSFFTLNEFINNEWKTDLVEKTDKDGMISFRGFRGKYRLSWTDGNGKVHTSEIHCD